MHPDPFKGIAALFGIFVVCPVLLFFVLRWLLRPLIRRAKAATAFGVEVTSVGYLLYLAQVIFLIVCVVSYKLESPIWLSAALHTRAGQIAAIIVAVLAFNISASWLSRRGHPPFRRRVGREV